MELVVTLLRATSLTPPRGAVAIKMSMLTRTARSEHLIKHSLRQSRARHCEQEHTSDNSVASPSARVDAIKCPLTASANEEIRSAVGCLRQRASGQFAQFSNHQPLQHHNTSVQAAITPKVCKMLSPAMMGAFHTQTFVNRLACRQKETADGFHNSGWHRFRDLMHPRALSDAEI